MCRGSRCGGTHVTSREKDCTPEPERGDYERFEHYIGALREASEGKPVQVAIENMERKVNSLLCTPESVRELLDREPWLNLTLDVSHAMGTSVEEVHTYIDLCHERLANVHISCAEKGGCIFLPPDALIVQGYSGILTR